MPIGMGMPGGARMCGQTPSSCGPRVRPYGRSRRIVERWWERVRYAGTRRAMCPPLRATARFAIIATFAGLSASPTIARLTTGSGDLDPTHAWEPGSAHPLTVMLTGSSHVLRQSLTTLPQDGCTMESVLRMSIGPADKAGIHGRGISGRGVRNLQ